MMEQLRQRLKTWLNGPLPSQPNPLSLLQDRMDFLETRMNQLSVQSDIIPDDHFISGGVDEGQLAHLPDAHLGAQ